MFAAIICAGLNMFPITAFEACGERADISLKTLSTCLPRRSTPIRICSSRSGGFAMLAAAQTFAHSSAARFVPQKRGRHLGDLLRQQLEGSLSRPLIPPTGPSKLST
jgi:hypothetical protein